MIGPLDEEPTVSAECLFVDPIADIAVLGSPDNQELPDKSKAYEALMKATARLSISDAPEIAPAWLLSLEGRWFRCHARHSGGLLWVYDAAEKIIPGMSGSPIITDTGSCATGVVCTGADGKQERESGPHARLVNYLPGWLLRELVWAAGNRD